VLKCQKYVRTFLLIRESRILAITKVWDNFEGTWWFQRQKGLKGSIEFIDDKRGKKDTKKKKGRKDDNERVTSRIPE
jgi:hypothetical protein